jgi:hypothetical protein
MPMMKRDARDGRDANGKVTTPKPRPKGRARERGLALRVTERQRKAVQLRIAGCSYRRIATELNISAQQAHRDIAAALDASKAERDELTDQYRELELERLDAMTLSIWPSVQKGDCEAVRTAVRLSERRCRLLGLDAEVRTRIEMAGGSPLVTVIPASPVSALSDDELVARYERMRAVLPKPEPAPEPVAEPEPLSAEARYAAALAEREAMRRTLATR